MSYQKKLNNLLLSELETTLARLRKRMKERQSRGLNDDLTIEGAILEKQLKESIRKGGCLNEKK